MKTAYLRYQCDQIGRFLKVLGDKICNKSSPNYYQLFGLFEKPHSYVKTAVATSWVTFGLFFTPTSGHTVAHIPKCLLSDFNMICINVLRRRIALYCTTMAGASVKQQQQHQHHNTT